MVPARVADILDQLNKSAAATLESKVLEFKSWCKNPKELSYEIAEAAVCLANAEGGLIIVGVDDKKAGIAGLRPCPYPSITTEWIKRVIRDLTHPPVQCNVAKSTELMLHLENTAFRDLFIIEVHKTGHPSGHRTHKGVAYVRLDKECRPEYFTDQDDYTGLWLDHATVNDLSASSIEEAIKKRETVHPHVRRLGHRSIDHLTETGLVRLREGAFIPTPECLVSSVAAFLFLGKEESIRSEFSAAGTVVAVETSISSPLTSWNWLNIVDSVRSYVPLINRELTAREAQLPESIITELLLNAYIHRCYRTSGAIQIRIGENEIEIQNPGGLLGGLTTENLLYSPPIYRNFALADAARQFGYCEKAGTGIDKVCYNVILEGLDFPYFHSVGNSFSVIIKTKRDVPFAKLIKQFAGQLNLTITDLIVMRTLRSRDGATIEYLAQLAQRPTPYMEDALKDLQRRNIVDRGIRGRYHLAEPVLNQIAQYDDERQGTLFN